MSNFLLKYDNRSVNPGSENSNRKGLKNRVIALRRTKWIMVLITENDIIVTIQRRDFQNPLVSDDRKEKD